MPRNRKSRKRKLMQQKKLKSSLIQTQHQRGLTPSEASQLKVVDVGKRQASKLEKDNA